MASLNPHVPDASERSISSSASPDRALVASDDDHTESKSFEPSIYKSLNERKTTRGGIPAKKRGPKPNSKPALTRRQELNRQAQRTHRERKELYIKALEDEVLRLKEVFSNVSIDREKLADENKRLKDALNSAGLSSPSPNTAGSSTSQGPSSSSACTPPLTSNSTAPSIPSPNQGVISMGQSTSTWQQPNDFQQALSQTGRAVEQAGIDFVLTLEKPCMAHIQFMVERAADPDGEPCGHALMACCPPDPSPEARPGVPFGNANVPASCGLQKTWDLPKADLATLLDLSKRFDLDGEVTPIMAWGMLLCHPRAKELGVDDYRVLTEQLVRKVRCYGFGAVMEEFEVRDALDNLLSSKDSIMVN